MRETAKRASDPLLDLLPDRLDLGVLEAEELGDAARELVLDGGHLAVRVHDSPDHLDEAQALRPCELFAHQFRELVQIDTLAPLLLREAHDLLDVLRGDAEILAHGAQDALALL